MGPVNPEPSIAMKTLLTSLIAGIHLALTAVSPANPQPGDDVRILSIQRHHDGNDVWLEAAPNSLVALWISEDFDHWNAIDVAAEIQPGLFVVHHSLQAVPARGFYVGATLTPVCQPVPQDFVQQLVGQVSFFDHLTDAQKAALGASAAAWKEKLEELDEARQRLHDAQRALSDCLKLVAEARLAMQQAEADAQGARDAADQAAQDAQNAADYVGDLYDDLAHAESEAARWAREMQVLLEWAARYEAEGNTFHAEQLRDNADSYHDTYNDWVNEASRLNGQIAQAEADAIDAANQAEAAAAAADAADQAAADARAAYEEAKRRCDPKRDDVQDAADEVDAAADAAQDAAEDHADAEAEAEEQGRQNRDDAEAGGGGGGGDEEADESEGGDPQDGDSGTVAPTQRAREIAKFLEFMRTHGGADAYESALRTMFAKELEAGLVTLQGLSSGMQNLAKGLPAQAADFARGMSGGLLQFGYGMIVTWVQGAIEDAVVRLATRRIAQHANTEVQTPNSAKCNTNEKNGTAELYIQNPDKTVTVMVFRQSTGLSGGTYAVPGITPGASR